MTGELQKENCREVKEKRGAYQCRTSCPRWPHGVPPLAQGGSDTLQDRMHRLLNVQVQVTSRSTDWCTSTKSLVIRWGVQTIFKPGGSLLHCARRSWGHHSEPNRSEAIKAHSAIYMYSFVTAGLFVSFNSLQNNKCW